MSEKSRSRSLLGKLKPSRDSITLKKATSPKASHANTNSECRRQPLPPGMGFHKLIDGDGPLPPRPAQAKASPSLPNYVLGGSEPGSVGESTGVPQGFLHNIICLEDVDALASNSPSTPKHERVHVLNELPNSTPSPSGGAQGFMAFADPGEVAKIEVETSLRLAKGFSSFLDEDTVEQYSWMQEQQRKGAHNGVALNVIKEMQSQGLKQELSNPKGGAVGFLSLARQNTDWYDFEDSKRAVMMRAVVASGKVFDQKLAMLVGRFGDAATHAANAEPLDNSRWLGQSRTQSGPHILDMPKVRVFHKSYSVGQRPEPSLLAMPSLDVSLSQADATRRAADERFEAPNSTEKAQLVRSPSCPLPAGLKRGAIATKAIVNNKSAPARKCITTVDGSHIFAHPPKAPAPPVSFDDLMRALAASGGARTAKDALLFDCALYCFDYFTDEFHLLSNLVLSLFKTVSKYVREDAPQERAKAMTSPPSVLMPAFSSSQSSPVVVYSKRRGSKGSHGPGEKIKDSHNRRMLSIVKFLRRFCALHRGVLQGMPAVFDLLEARFSRLAALPPPFCKWGVNLMHHLRSAPAAPEPLAFSDVPCTPIDLLQVQPKQLATALHELSYQLYRRLPWKCLLHMSWRSYPEYKELTRLIVNTSLFVMSSILCADSKHTIMLCIQRWLDVGMFLYKMNNFALLDSVVSTLSSSRISRLHYMKSLSKSKNLLFRELKKIVSYENNYRSMRALLHNVAAPFVPLMGMWTKDLVYVEEVLKKRPSRSHSVPVNQLALMVAMVKKLREGQAPPTAAEGMDAGTHALLVSLGHMLVNDIQPDTNIKTLSGVTVGKAPLVFMGEEYTWEASYLAKPRSAEPSIVGRPISASQLMMLAVASLNHPTTTAAAAAVTPTFTAMRLSYDGYALESPGRADSQPPSLNSPATPHKRAWPASDTPSPRTDAGTGPLTRASLHTFLDRFNAGAEGANQLTTALAGVAHTRANVAMWAHRVQDTPHTAGSPDYDLASLEEARRAHLEALSAMEALLRHMRESLG